MQPAPSATDAYNRALAAPAREQPDPLPLQIEGHIPADLHGGTWWGNGPGALSFGDPGAPWRVHPFDGSGFVRAVRFDADRGRPGARLQSRFVQTPVYTAEQQADALRYRGLGTLPPGGWWQRLRMPMGRSVANTCVLPWAGKLLALYEGAPPQALDPQTLCTLGPETFHGALGPDTAFLAHTRHDAARDLLIGLSPRILGPSVELTARAIDRAGHEVWRRTERLDRFSLYHDLAATPGYVVLLESSVDVSLPGVGMAMLGMRTILDAISFVERPARVLLIPRDSARPTQIFELDRPMLSVHHANAWEQDGPGGPRVHLLTCGLPSFKFGSEFGWRGPSLPFDAADTAGNCQNLYHITLDPASGRASTAVRAPLALDFPRIDPRLDGLPARHLYGVLTRLPTPDSPPFAALAHLDLADPCDPAGTADRRARWLPGPGAFVGEPVPVPKRGAAPGGDAACWVLAMIYEPDQQRCRLCVFDGADIAAGPVGAVLLPQVPYGFHGCWEPAP